MTKILVVEDNEVDQRILRRRLERAGFEVSIVGDGGPVVERARAEMPDVILMDLLLREVDGWEATRQLKADPGLQRIPVIALTAYATPADRDRALAAGCDDFDVKPIDMYRLQRKIEAQLRRVAG